MAASPAVAEVYTWRSPDGVLHYSDYPKHDGYARLQPVPGNRPAAARYADWTRPRIRAEIERLAYRYQLDPDDVVVPVVTNVCDVLGVLVLFGVYQVVA
jgi:hypothetical protein